MPANTRKRVCLTSIHGGSKCTKPQPLCSHFNHIFATADILAPPTFVSCHCSPISISAANRCPSSFPPLLHRQRHPRPSKIRSRRDEEARQVVGKQPVRAQATCPSTNPEFWETRVGVFAFLCDPDPDTPPDVRAHTTVNHINAIIGDSPGLKARPVVVPGTGFAKFTIVRKEIDVQSQDLLKSGVFITERGNK